MLKWNKKFGKILKTATDMRLAAMAIYAISDYQKKVRQSLVRLPGTNHQQFLNSGKEDKIQKKL